VSVNDLSVGRNVDETLRNAAAVHAAAVALESVGVTVAA